VNARKGKKKMNGRQSGISLLGLITGLFVLIFLALLAFKVLPPILEFRTAKGAIEAVARERQTSTVQEIRKAFDARANIDDIASVKGSDLEVTKEGGEVVISFAYRREVPLFANIGVYLDFAANSKGTD
jgi:hypothetical protein